MAISLFAVGAGVEVARAEALRAEAGASAAVATGALVSSHHRSTMRPTGGAPARPPPGSRADFDSAATSRTSREIPLAISLKASSVETTASAPRSRSVRRRSSSLATSIARASPGLGGSPASARFSARSARISIGVSTCGCDGLANGADRVEVKISAVVERIWNTA